MMMKITRFLRVAAVALVATAAIPLQSQADTTLRWNGTDPATLLKNSATETFYLYNVGTGKFLRADGEWGIQGLLMYQTFGTGMYLQKATDCVATITSNDTTYTSYTSYGYVINSGVDTKVQSRSSGAQYVGLNIPNYSNADTKWKTDNTFGIIFDTRSYDKSGVPYYNRYLSFERDTTYPDTVFAYKIKEVIRKNSDITSKDYTDSVTYYWGSKVGRNQYNVWTTDNGDIATFAMVDSIGVTADDISAVKDYYTWVLVSEKELSNAHVKNVNQGGGLVANMSYLLHDQYFDRNRTSFNTAWTVVDKSKATASNGYRWDWTKAPSSYYDYDYGVTEDVWSKAVFRKITCDTKASGKYSFASFEGIGVAYTKFEVPADGYYDFEIRGFCQGSNPAYFFAATSVDGTDKVEIALPSVKSGTTFSKSYTEAVLSAPGKVLYENDSNYYTVKIQLKVNSGQTVYLGIHKDDATKSSYDYRTDYDYRTGRWGTYYYHDTDYVGVDNLQVYYVGSEQLVLDDEKEDTTYMKEYTTKNKNGTVVYLKRSFTVNKWNTLVLPIDLTAAQVKEAFGEDTKLAGLKGVRAGDNINSIDFETISLEKDSNVLERGKMYLIKPVKLGTEMTIPGYENTKMYTLGRRVLDGPTKYVNPVATVNGVKFTGTYIALNAEKGPQVGSYVFSGGDMYYLKNSAKSIKGFRGWFETIPGNSIKFNIGSGEITGIDEVTTGDSKAKANGAVFTIDGVKVRDNAISLDGLPAGIYIYNGKKHLVK